MIRRLSRLLPALAILLLPCGPAPAQDRTPPNVRVGSKAFAESWILGEALAMLAREGGARARHVANIGGTDLVFRALTAGQIDAYPEYTGTIAESLLKSRGRPTLDELRGALRPQGIGISDPLGFNNGYALAVTRETAERYGLRTLSDLREHPGLRLGFTHEFLERQDGWPGLSAAYGLPHRSVRGMEHALAYEAVRTGQIDAMEIYTTDARIEALDLRLLEDDRGFFPRYDAVILYRLDLPRRAPGAWESMQRLVGRISEAEMIRANGLVELKKQSYESAAAALIGAALPDGAPRVAARRPSPAAYLLRKTGEHLVLVAVSLLAAALLGIPLGIGAARSRPLGRVTLTLTGVIQTIPSLALLAFLIPVLGMEQPPAIAALFLYSLLPIVRNTYVGLTTIPLPLRESAEALGLSPTASLRRVELPLASPAIMAGLKTSAVINVGTATLGGLIGAGGLGDPIWTGIQTANTGLVLMGAGAAAVLALLVQGAFDLLERLVVPRGLRLRPASED
ncbi:MAG: glycine betaine ABC transporter substrate-binding protein [Armatimonadota bacterium]